MYKISYAKRENRCTNNCSMLTLPKTTLLAKLYCRNGDPLRFKRHKKSLKGLLLISFAEPPLPSYLASQVPRPQFMGLLIERWRGLPVVASLP
ncbi:hypothetical protein TNCV_3417961 [Trichonephila clavipes]|nr:hypothetical protein TNCV_3417961 [Trichonephila clavipes]